MKKKQSPKRRQKLNTRQQRPSRSKSRARVQTDADVTEDQAINSGEPTQSGDTQGLSGVADANFESVKELTEEGQYLEAEVVDAVENAPGADSGAVKTKEVPEDDVPSEYRDPENRERQS